MATRREWMIYSSLAAFGAAGGAVARGGAARAAMAHPVTADANSSVPTLDAPDASAEAPAPWWAFAPLAAGSALAGGWHLDGLSPVRAGYTTLTLRHDSGNTAVVRVHRREGAPNGIAQSEHLDFLLMNDAQGNAATSEDLGRVILGLAQVVRQNEASVDHDVLAALSAHDEAAAMATA